MKGYKILVCLSFIIFTGCSNVKAEGNLSATLPYKYSYNEYSASTDKSNTQKSKEIRQALLEIEGIRDVYVYVTGQTALIGYNTSAENISVNEIGRLKKEITKIVNECDVGIKNTAITANKEISNMIENMEKS